MFVMQAKVYRQWLMMAVLALSLCVVAQAADPVAPGTTASDEYQVPHDSLRKLGRGITNVLFGFIELPKNIVEVNSTNGGFAAITWGILLGFDRWGTREVKGVKEISTFRQPEKTVILPEFPYDLTYDDRWRIRNMAESY